MKELTFEGNKFISYENEDVKFVFSTAENGLNFNKSIPEGLENLEKLKNWFDLKEVGYCNQIHSDIVRAFEENNKDGDALITDSVNTAVGVFTADCVPVLLFDKENKIIAAVHSGWRGTVKNIVGKTTTKMISEYGSRAENIIAYIGPHNRQCCYEVGTEVIEEFEKNEAFRNIDYINGRNISLAACITKQLLDSEILSGNINDMVLCTFCSEEYKLHSYRKGENNYGRMFSFIYLKD